MPLDDKNPPKGPGSAESALMDFTAPDRAPDLLLNEIVWKSVKGAHSVMPPPKRGGLPAARIDKDDD